MRVSVVGACFEFFESRRGGRRGAARSPCGAESSPSRPSRRRGRRGRRVRTPWTRAWRSPAAGARSSWWPWYLSLAVQTRRGFWRTGRAALPTRRAVDAMRRRPRRSRVCGVRTAGSGTAARGVDGGACVPGSRRADALTARRVQPAPRLAVSRTFKRTRLFSTRAKPGDRPRPGYTYISGSG